MLVLRYFNRNSHAHEHFTCTGTLPVPVHRYRGIFRSLGENKTRVIIGSFHIAFIWIGDTLHVVKIQVLFKIANLRIRYLSQYTSGPISYRNECSFCVRHDPFWCYHVNKHSFTRRNREWTRAGAKVAPVSSKHPLIIVLLYSRTPVTRTLIGNEKTLWVGGGSSYRGRLNPQFAMLTTDS